MQFLNQPPTPEQLREALANVPTIEGLDLSEWAEHVTIIPSNKKQASSDWIKVYTVYFDVAARIVMARKWHMDRDATMTLKKKTLNAEGNPAADRFFLCSVELESSVLGPAIGYATADLSEAGSGADRTNPIENALTSAMGRALGEWGFGLIPGSGAVASADEISTALERKGKATRPSQAQKKRSNDNEQEPPPQEEDTDEQATEIMEGIRKRNLEMLEEKARVAFGDEAEVKLRQFYAKQTKIEIDNVPPLKDWSSEAVSAALALLRKHHPQAFKKDS